MLGGLPYCMGVGVDWEAIDLNDSDPVWHAVLRVIIAVEGAVLG